MSDVRKAVRRIQSEKLISKEKINDAVSLTTHIWEHDNNVDLVRVAVDRQ